jgi:hypothetical protein
MNIIMEKAQMKMVRLAVKAKVVLKDQRGEGFVDSAVLPFQDDYETMNTMQKIKYRVKKWKFNVTNNLSILFRRTRVILADQRGQGALDQVVSILISIVLGSMLLAGLYALFSNILLPAIQERVMDIFNFAG